MIKNIANNLVASLRAGGEQDSEFNVLPNMLDPTNVITLLSNVGTFSAIAVPMDMDEEASSRINVLSEDSNRRIFSNILPFLQPRNTIQRKVTQGTVQGDGTWMPVTSGAEVPLLGLEVVVTVKDKDIANSSFGVRHIFDPDGNSIEEMQFRLTGSGQYGFFIPVLQAITEVSITPEGLGSLAFKVNEVADGQNYIWISSGLVSQAELVKQNTACIEVTGVNVSIDVKPIEFAISSIQDVLLRAQDLWNQ